jgi:hypothetical protein
MIAGQTVRYALADRAYNAGYFRDAVTAIGTESVIPIEWCEPDR